MTSSPICNFNASLASSLSMSSTNGTSVPPPPPSSGDHPSPTSPTQPQPPSLPTNGNSNNKLINSTNSNDSSSSSSSSNPESSFYEDQLDNELESMTTTSIRNGKPKQQQNGGTATSTAQHVKPAKSKQQHVSFNINNAIYTSRQDTPIPISVLKQQQQQQQQQQGASPLQPSLKKTSIDDQPVVGKVKNKQVRIDAKTTIL